MSERSGRGISVVFRPNHGRGARIEHMEVAGESYRPDHLYTVAAAGLRDLPNSMEPQRTGVHAIDALRRHLEKSEVRPAVTGQTFMAQ